MGQNVTMSDSEKNRLEEEEARIDALWGCVESEMNEYIELSKEIWKISEGKENEWATSILKKTMSAVMRGRSVSGIEDKNFERDKDKRGRCVSEITLAFFEMEGLIPVKNNEKILNYFFDCIVESGGRHEEWENYLYDLQNFEKAPDSIITKVEDELKKQNKNGK